MLRTSLLVVCIALWGAAPPPVVFREERVVSMPGGTETWRLLWRGTPRDRNDCAPAEPDTAMTCPCSGVAYAQTGDLILERRRAGGRPERLPLTPLFRDSELPLPLGRGVAMLARWPVGPHDAARVPTPAAIHARPAVPIMQLRDYDHDGLAGEFLLQVSVAPCGKQVDVAVGVTRADPRLHVLTTAEHPDHPLTLYRFQWEALARSPRPGEVADWVCGDQGAEEETGMLLRADHGRLHATRITSTCPEEGGGDAGRAKPPYRKRVLGREIL